MGDLRRFDVFARMLSRNVPSGARVADVAAGKGALSFALRDLGFDVVPFEPKPRKGGHVRRLGMRVEEFRAGAGEFDAVVGMHPDGATDMILQAAIELGAFAAVVPCCVRPNAWAWGEARGSSYWAWMGHLIRQAGRRGLLLSETRLPMTGRNIVLYGRAKGAA